MTTPTMQPTDSVEEDDQVENTSPVPRPVVSFFAVLRKILGGAEAKREVIHESDSIAHQGSWELQCIVEVDELDGGYIAECPAVPGAVSQGETEEEALENLIDAVQGVVAVRMEDHFSHLNLEEATGTKSSGRVVSIQF